MKHTNRKYRIPRGLHPHRIEEKLIKRNVGGEWIIEREMTMISKDGTISKFPEYHSSEEEEEEEPTEQPRSLNTYGFDDDELERNEADADDEEEEEEPMEEEEEEVKEDSEKKRSKEASETGSNSESPGYAAIDDEVESDLESTARSEPKCKEREDTCERMVEIMDVPIKGSWHAILKSMMEREWNTQVQARGHKAAIGMSWTDFKALLVEEFCPSNEIEKLEIEYIAGLAPEIRGMLRATQPTTIQSAILRAEILTNEAVSCGTLTKGNEKRKGSGRDKQARRSSSKSAKCWTHHPEGGPCLVCFNCQKPSHFAWNCRMPVKQVAPINVIRGEHEPGTFGTLQDPNVMTGTFSLNNNFATVLFDSGAGADFSFISTNFAPLLNVKPTRKFLVQYIFDTLRSWSFDVIVGMDWLSKHKAEIVCHEKVVRIPLESGEILHVQGERIPGIAKALSNVNVDEPKLSAFRVRDLLRELNKLTVKNRYLLPRIDDLFDQL
ncbi:putative reverse transcriptase domain-containing protein [Tanacetum coccineum]